MPNNQRQHRTTHAPKDVLPLRICTPAGPTPPLGPNCGGCTPHLDSLSEGSQSRRPVMLSSVNVRRGVGAQKNPTARTHVRALSRALYLSLSLYRSLSLALSRSLSRARALSLSLSLYRLGPCVAVGGATPRRLNADLGSRSLREEEKEFFIANLLVLGEVDTFLGEVDMPLEPLAPRLLAGTATLRSQRCLTSGHRWSNTCLTSGTSLRSASPPCPRSAPPCLKEAQRGTNEHCRFTV